MRNETDHIFERIVKGAPYGGDGYALLMLLDRVYQRLPDLKDPLTACEVILIAHNVVSRIATQGKTPVLAAVRPAHGRYAVHCEHSWLVLGEPFDAIVDVLPVARLPSVQYVDLQGCAAHRALYVEQEAVPEHRTELIESLSETIAPLAIAEFVQRAAVMVGRGRPR